MSEAMAQATRTFRIFVSSTFSDLKEERNALQRYVFPRLRELCVQHGCWFQAINLGWGDPLRDPNVYQLSMTLLGQRTGKLVDV